MAKIKVFTTPTCPYCYLLKEYLKEKGVEFEELDVSQDKEALKELQKKTGALAVPVIEINGQIIIGFDKEKIDRSLNINNQ
jgi:glutaredoxin-like YruB-family protein